MNQFNIKNYMYTCLSQDLGEKSLIACIVCTDGDFLQLYKSKSIKEYVQNKRRHKIKQQKRKMVTLLRDLSSCTSCLLILGLLGGYEFR